MIKHDGKSHIIGIHFYIFSSINIWLKLLLLSFFLMNLPGNPFAQTTEEQLTFEKVQEKTYDDTISDIAFGSFVKDGVEQIYCKVIALKDKELQFLDTSGKILFRTPLPPQKFAEGKYYGRDVVLSKKKNFVGIHDYTGKMGEDNDYIVQEEYIICNDKGKEIYKINCSMEGAGSEDRFLISDEDASAVRTRFEYGALDFYSPDGGVKTVPLFNEPAWGRRAGDAIFSEDGEYLAVLVREIPKPSPGGTPSLKDFNVWVMLFDKSGTELWRRKVNEQQIDMYKEQKIAISDHGEYVAFKAFSIKGEIPPRKGEHRDLNSVTLGLFSKEGDESSLEDTSLFTFSSFCFSPEDDYLVMGGHNLIRLMRTQDNSIIFEKELPEDVGIRSTSFSTEGKYLIIDGQFTISTEKVPERGGAMNPVYASRIYMFDIKWDLVWQHDFSTRLKGFFSANGFLAFSTPYKYEIYREENEVKLGK